MPIQKIKETATAKPQQRPSFLFSFKVHYHGNTLVKEFNGIETTREAIEKVKTSKDIINRTGMPTTVYVSDNEVKITILNSLQRKTGLWQTGCKKNTYQKLA